MQNQESFLFGLKLISVSLLHLAALDTQPSEKDINCTPNKPLRVNVVSAEEDVRYDFSKKTAELNRMSKSAYSPYGDGHTNIETRGLTVGTQSLRHNIEFYFKKHKKEGLACVQIHKVNITMNYAPIVYVSTKFKQGTPIFNKTLDHEKEHIKITQRVIDKYKNIIKQQLRNELKHGFSAGPFPISNMNNEQQKLQKKVKKITAKIDLQMHEEAQRQHNLYDDAELDKSIEYNQGVARKLEKILKLNN